MNQISIKFYNFVGHLTQLLLKISGHRRNKYTERYSNHSNKQLQNKTLWIHGASAGEIDAALPLIEKFYTEYNIYVSFFSLSGYFHFKDNKLFDMVFLLPIDTKKNATKIIRTLNPNLVIWLNNELWLNILTEIRQNNIPLFLINANFSNRNNSNKLFTAFQKNCLKNFTAIHSSIENQFLDMLKIHYFLCPNMKLERAYQNVVTNFDNKIMENHLLHEKILLLGSVYPEEIQAFLFHNYNIDFPYSIWIFPHHLDEKNINNIKNIYDSKDIRHRHRIIVFDKPHLLRYAYRYATCIYVGGGFRKGVHNIFEALVYNKFIVSGNNYKYHPDAKPWLADDNIIVTYTLQEAVKTCNNLMMSQNSPMQHDFSRLKASSIIYNWIIDNTKR